MGTKYVLEDFYAFFENLHPVALVLFGLACSIVVMLAGPIISMLIGGFVGWCIPTFAQRGRFGLSVALVGSYFLPMLAIVIAVFVFA